MYACIYVIQIFLADGSIRGTTRGPGGPKKLPIALQLILPAPAGCQLWIGGIETSSCSFLGKRSQLRVKAELGSCFQQNFGLECWDQFHLLIAGCPLNVPAMSGLGVHFEEIEENVSSSEICDSINLALDAVLNWLQEAHGSQVNK